MTMYNVHCACYKIILILQKYRVFPEKQPEPEPGVFGSLDLEPLEEKRQEPKPKPEPLGKKVILLFSYFFVVLPY